MNDEIIEEVRRIRVELAAEAKYDLSEMARRAAKAASDHRRRLATPRGEAFSKTPSGGASSVPGGVHP